MPKTKFSIKSRLRAYVKEFYVFKTDVEVRFCKLCNVTIIAGKKSQVVQHVESSKHKGNVKRNCGSTNQSFLSESMNKNITHQEFSIG